MIAFWMNVFKVVGYAARFRLADAMELVDFSARLIPDEQIRKDIDRQTAQQARDQADLENRKRMLIGVYVLFFGFVLQFFGALSWCIDAFFDVFGGH
jgi:hypothetical protein